MPLIEPSSYLAPSWLPGGHLQTIWPALFRPIGNVPARAERLELDDGDFIDLAWSGASSFRLAILSHGLEADRHTGMGARTGDKVGKHPQRSGWRIHCQRVASEP